MTSRRGLMKLLAALPFAAPVVAKEMAAQFPGKALMGARFVAGPLIDADSISVVSYGERVAFTDPLSLPRARHWVAIDSARDHDINTPNALHDAAPTQPNEALRALLCGPARSDTPNRLYGVRINSDGDAV